MSILAKDCDFSPYAQLVAALLPRAAGVSVFEPDGDLRWTSEESITPGMLKLVLASATSATTSTESGERLQFSQHDPLYLFWLRDEAQQLTGLFAITWRTGESEQRTFAYVHAMLRPVLECLRRELALRAQSTDAARSHAIDTDSGDDDLQVLLSTSDSFRSDGADEGIRHLLENTNKHMRCEFTALVVPERNLVVVSKAEGREVDTSVLARLHRQLLSLAQVRTEATVLNEVDSLPGVTLPFRVLSSPIRNPAGRPAGMLVLFRSREAQEFRRRDAMLSDLLSRRAANMIDSSYDTLSGLLTRRAFEQRARVLLDQRAATGRVARWTSLYIDTDRMHVINDNYGMHVGDKLLARLGELIRSRLVPGSLAARISGDRFAILLPTAEADATSFAEALRAGVEALVGAHLGATDASFSASISIGIAAINDPRVDLPHALAVAETACKAAKDRGRNRVELYQASDVSIMRRYEDINIAPSLRAAISENRLRLDAQLIAPMSATAAVPHFELLLRMIDEQGETVGPGRFMSAAVRYQLMPAVDRWVVQEAVRLLTPHAPLLRDCPVVFTINLSGQSLGEDGFVDLIIEQITASRIPPKVFCFELTESAAIANLAHAETLMKRLRHFGCTIALDDFGTGLSSLAYLRALPVDMLKIDGSFVRDVLKDPRAESMVQAIAQLARSMNLVTVAEYVETDEIRLRVAQLGVDYAQGFAIARPAPFAEAIRDLPTYASVAKRLHGEEIEISAADDTISAELHQQLLAAGIDLADANDTQRRMEKILAGYDHTESTLYQRKANGG